MRASLGKFDPLIDLFRTGGGLIALLLTLTASLILPPAAHGFAIVRTAFLNDGSGHAGGPGLPEGDPLDSNDSGGGGSGDVVHQDRALPDGSGVKPLPGHSGFAQYRIETVVENGKVRHIVIIQSVSNLVPEAMHVR